MRIVMQKEIFKAGQGRNVLYFLFFLFFFFFFIFLFQNYSRLSLSRGPRDSLKDFETYQLCGTEENNKSNNHTLKNKYAI